MSNTKQCPKCSSTLDFLADSCAQCHFLFKDRILCQQCFGAYPLSKLKWAENFIWCENCLQKQNDFIQQRAFNPTPLKKKSSPSSIPALLWAIFPLFGAFKLLRKETTVTPKTPNYFLGFNLLWSVLVLYLGSEYYFFYHQQNPSAKICLRIKEIQQAQEAYKKKKNHYGMLEHLIENQCLPWKIEITARQVFTEKEDYHFRIYVASKEIWKLKANPKESQSFSLKFYSDQSGQIRFAYQAEADETSILWTPETLTFFHYLLQESWLSRFLYHYL
ncbi:MAG: hypothetical protein AABZ60_25260 [Planctomycetota bacterium]